MSASANLALEAPRVSLPEPFAGWFRARCWRPHAHQLELLDKVAGGRDALLIAPTGGGKTLAGFLPSLVDLAHREATPRLAARPTIHALYVSPLEALAVDIARNLSTPIEEMELPISLETRTGDSPPSRRARQRISPPDILLTTPADRLDVIAPRRCQAVRLAQDSDFRRTSRARIEQARRSARTRSRAASHLFTQSHRHRTLSNGSAALRACRVPRAA